MEEKMSQQRKLREKKKRKEPKEHFENKRKAGLIFFCVNNDGSVVGYTENSFSMGFSVERIHLFRKNAKGTDRSNRYAQNILKELKIKFPKSLWFMLRAGSKDCPLILDWKSYHEKRHNGELHKYDWRNLAFRVDEDKLDKLLARNLAVR